MNWYIQYVNSYPIESTMVQFAFLGTFGEIISRWIFKKKLFYPFTFFGTIWKMFSWSILAACIKYAFVGTEGYVNALIDHPNALLPLIYRDSPFLHAFAKSVLINLQFGLFLVIFHRILDNLFVTNKNWNNLDKALFTLIWFWIPILTFVFFLLPEYYIVLGAIGSVVLGFMLGIFVAKPSKRNRMKKKMVLANYFIL